MALPDFAKDPKVIAAIMTALLAVAGVSGVSAVDANKERDDAIERAVLRVRQDIDHGYNMCRQEWIERKEAGEADRVPRVPKKRIERIANEAIQQAVEAK